MTILHGENCMLSEFKQKLDVLMEKSGYRKYANRENLLPYKIVNFVNDKFNAFLCAVLFGVFCGVILGKLSPWFFMISGVAVALGVSAFLLSILLDRRNYALITHVFQYFEKPENLKELYDTLAVRYAKQDRTQELDEIFLGIIENNVFGDGLSYYKNRFLESLEGWDNWDSSIIKQQAKQQRLAAEQEAEAQRVLQLMQSVTGKKEVVKKEEKDEQVAYERYL